MGLKQQKLVPFFVGKLLVFADLDSKKMPVKAQSLPSKVPKHANDRQNWRFAKMICRSYI
jgi:hypothetical protein